MLQMLKHATSREAFILVSEVTYV